jgi:hypothetical protein
MIEILSFFLAGSALGGMSAWLHKRQPSTLVVLVGLYAIALAVCFLIGHATRVGVMAFVAPYLLVAIAASLWCAGLAVQWPGDWSSSVERTAIWNVLRGRNRRVGA